MSKKVIAAILLFAALILLNGCKDNENKDKKNEVSVTQTVSDTKETDSSSIKKKMSETSAVSDNKVKSSASEETLKNSDSSEVMSDLKSDWGIISDNNLNDKNEDKNNNKSDNIITDNKINPVQTQQESENNTESQTARNKEDVIELPIIPIE